MEINFDKRPGQRILELGCGEKRHPLADCAVDARKLPHVDFIVDMNFPFDAEHGQAIGSAEFDAVLSVYSIEHVSWRNFRGLLKEICRILKPGGKLVAVTANLYEQCKMFVEKSDASDFDDRWVCQIFGDQNYGEGDDGKAWLANAHFVGFDPKKLALMLREAGFADVSIAPLPEWKGDLVVQATKKMQDHEVNADGFNSAGTRGPMGPPPASGQVTGPGIEIDPNDVERWAEFNKAIATDETKTLAADEAQTKHLSWMQKMPGHGYDEKGRTWVTDKDGNTRMLDNHPPPLETTEQRAAKFGRKYFDGGPAYPPPLGYHDHPSNHVVARRVLERQPKSILSLGCGRGYVEKRLEDAGVSVLGFDISKHAWMTRVCNAVKQADVCEEWDVAGVCDLAFSFNFLEHVPEALLPAVVAEMERTCKRGLHGIGFAANADPTRVTIRDRKWWRERLPKGHEVVDAEELRAGPIPEDVLKGSGKLCLNVGSFVTMYHGWTNIDVHDLAQFANAYGYKYFRHDVRQGLPYGTGSVDLISMSHFLEHLSYDDGLQFLRECRRVIKPDGAVRLAVPCTSQLVAVYLEDIAEFGSGGKGLAEFDEISGGCANRKTTAAKLWETLMAGGHQALYDWDTLQEALTNAGFQPAVAQFRQPGFPLNDACKQILRETLDVGVSHSLYADAIPAIG